MTPGYHRISMERYLSDPCAVPSINSSIAQIILSESPKKAWFSHPRLNPSFHGKEDTKFDIGTAAHALLLEGMNVMEVLDFPDYKTKESRARRDEARAAGKVPMLTKHADAVVAMAQTAEAFIVESEIAEHWWDSESELTGICEEQNIWLRCRFDRITKSRRFIIDYKSTIDAAPEPFSRLLVRMGYHIQEAFYRRVARNLGAVGPRFAFLAQSCEPPYECSLHGCDESLRQVADSEVERALQLWRRCVKEHLWPSHGGRIHWALPPTYMLQEYEMRLSEAA